MSNTEYVKAGYLDFIEQTPWQRSPITYEDWRAGAADTDASLAYWHGFDGAGKDALK